MALLQKPDAVRSRNALNHAMPWLARPRRSEPSSGSSRSVDGRAHHRRPVVGPHRRARQPVAPSDPREAPAASCTRWCRAPPSARRPPPPGSACRAKRRAHSRSSQARPPRICTWLDSRWRGSASGSMSTKSMNSGTCASVALPERSSRGITMSTSTRTVAHSWGVKNFGAKAGPFCRARRSCALCACASETANPPASGRAPSILRICRRPVGTSAVFTASPFRDSSAMYVRGAPGQGQDGPGRVLVRVGDERSRVGHEQVLHLVRLRVLVEHRRRGAVAHARGARLVDDVAAGPDAVARLLRRHGRQHLAPHLVDDLAGDQWECFICRCS